MIRYESQLKLFILYQITNGNVFLKTLQLLIVVKQKHAAMM